MDKKTIIQSIIITACFVGTGIVLFKGFSGDSSPGLAATSQTLNPGKTEKILPGGEKFDIDTILGKHKLQFGRYTYPKLDFGSEVGKPETELVSPLPDRITP
jgi:hypothetical protein